MKDDELSERVGEVRKPDRAKERWNGYIVSYDKTYLLETIRELGINDEITAELMARAIACYTVSYGKKMNEIFKYLAEEKKVGQNSIAMRFKRALSIAEANGDLKYIDTIVSGVVYDYDYGYTVREFIALLGAHMGDTDRLKVQKE